MSEAPKINYDRLAPDRREAHADELSTELKLVQAERSRAQLACEQLGERNTKLRSALLQISAIIETQLEPDIDAMHDIAREALKA